MSTSARFTPDPRIVDALTESWGVDTLGDGKVVWWRSPLRRRHQPR